MELLLRQRDWIRAAFGLYPLSGDRVAPFRDASWEGYRDRAVSDSLVGKILHSLRLGTAGPSVVHRTRHRTTFRWEPPSRGEDAVYVKRYRCTELSLYHPRTYLQIGHAEKAFRLSYALMERKVATARPVFFLRARQRGIRKDAMLATIGLGETANLRAFMRESYSRMEDEAKDRWIDRLAGYLAELHRRGVLHGDLASNALWSPGTDEFYLIDLDSIRLLGTLLPRDRQGQLTTLIGRLPEFERDGRRVDRFRISYEKRFGAKDG